MRVAILGPTGSWRFDIKDMPMTKFTMAPKFIKPQAVAADASTPDSETKIPLDITSPVKATPQK